MVEACSLSLYPEENSWHFITVTPTVADRVIAFAISVSITGKQYSGPNPAFLKSRGMMQKLIGKIPSGDKI